jgi:amidase
MMIAGPDVAVCGPLARSAEDLALAMGVLVGPEPLDRRGWQLALPEPAKSSLRDFKVAVWPTDDLAPVAGEVADRVARVAETLAKLGATVSDTARPRIEKKLGHVTYLNLLNSLTSAGLPPDAYARMQALAARTDPADFSDDAVLTRAAVLSHREWLGAHNYRESLRYAWREFFDAWDVLVCPQSAGTAFAHDHSEIEKRQIEVDGREQPYFQQVFWSGLVSVAQLPSTVFPTGPSRAGLPIGLQAVGAEYDDFLTIEFARLLAREIGGFVPPPAYA